jgi:co-chaperonin GroES (HSP10)
MKIKPLKGQALVEILPPETKHGSLYLSAPDPKPETKQDGVKAKVLRVGPWRTTRDGKALLPEFKPGDIVLVSSYRGKKLSAGVSGRLLLIDTSEVLAVLS